MRIFVIVGALLVASGAAQAGDPCDGLWFKRNAIYAAAGYCFDTEAGIRNFGRRCFPPYGRLMRGQQARVNDILRRERRLRCSG